MSVTNLYICNMKVLFTEHHKLYIKLYGYTLEPKLHLIATFEVMYRAQESFLVFFSNVII